MRLSTHFTLAEMTTSETAARRGLPNNPGPAELSNLRRMANLLEQIRAKIGGPIVITSGYRAPAVNAAVGGSPNSDHMQGRAADCHRPGLTMRQFAERIVASGVPFDNLILEFDSWVHIAVASEGATPRRQVGTISARTGGKWRAGLL
jgi:uncharacterized protein YcbK (DUF882 family)